MKVLVVGGGAQAKYALEIYRLRAIKVVAVMDINPAPGLDWAAAYSCTVVGFDPRLACARNLSATHVLPCSGSPAQRRALWEQVVPEANLPVPDAVHPRATVATTARLGEGVIVNAGAVIQPFATIGRGAMIHANVVVDHDSVVGEFANLAPGVDLAGWVTVGPGATLFTGASVIPKVRIGARSIVGAGAVVIGDVPEDSVAVGAPARVVKSI